MMTLPVYIGDEVSAAGYRLAGLRVRVPAAGAARQELDWAIEQAPLVLLSTTVASEIAERELDHYLSLRNPAVVIVPDVHGVSPMIDLSERLRKQLGMQE